MIQWLRLYAPIARGLGLIPHATSKCLYVTTKDLAQSTKLINKNKYLKRVFKNILLYISLYVKHSHECLLEWDFSQKDPLVHLMGPFHFLVI